MIDDEIKEIVKPGFGSICDGKSDNFCLIYKRDGRFTDVWRNWWIEFSRFKASNIKGRPLSNITMDDYTFLKLGITAGWLMVKKKNWVGLKVCYLSFLPRIA
jgi:hypothetical protein